jgi:UDPglucose 6-dehydrogenase
MPLHLVERVDALLGGVRGVEIAVLGLAFKPGTDDVRESPALPIVRQLAQRGAKIRACDPLSLAVDNFRREVGELEGVEYFTDVNEALKGARAACYVTPWPQFDLPAGDYAALMQPGGLFYDGRCRHAADAFTSAGLQYAGIGYAL